MLKKGDRIAIFHDPITQTNLEGSAVLVRRISVDHVDHIERWMVRFDGDASLYERAVSIA